MPSLPTSTRIPLQIREDSTGIININPKTFHSNIICLCSMNTIEIHPLQQMHNSDPACKVRSEQFAKGIGSHHSAWSARIDIQGIDQILHRDLWIQDLLPHRRGQPHRGTIFPAVLVPFTQARTAKAMNSPFASCPAAFAPVLIALSTMHSAVLGDDCLSSSRVTTFQLTGDTKGGRRNPPQPLTPSTSGKEKLHKAHLPVVGGFKRDSKGGRKEDTHIQRGLHKTHTFQLTTSNWGLRSAWNSTSTMTAWSLQFRSPRSLKTNGFNHLASSCHFLQARKEGTASPPSSSAATACSVRWALQSFLWRGQCSVCPGREVGARGAALAFTIKHRAKGAMQAHDGIDGPWLIGCMACMAPG